MPRSNQVTLGTREAIRHPVIDVQFEHEAQFLVLFLDSCRSKSHSRPNTAVSPPSVSLGCWYSRGAHILGEFKTSNPQFIHAETEFGVEFPDILTKSTRTNAFSED
jgi:hypothetical protein